MIQLENINKKYNEKWVLKNINLKIDEGVHQAIIGPNGAGKTTLLKIIALLDDDYTGKIKYRNIPISQKNRDKIRRKITMVFQKNIVLNRSVYDNVAYGLKIRGLNAKKIEEKVSWALKLVDLKELKNRNALKLSEGEQKRLAIARAIAIDPEVLILDEPLTNLDPTNTQKIMEIIKEISRETTIIMASHNIAHAIQVCSKTAYIRNGEIIENKPTPLLVSSPIDAEMARYLGYENIKKGKIIEVKNGIGKIMLGHKTFLFAPASWKGSCKIAIRPEDILIQKTMIKSSARNMLNAVIKEIIPNPPLVRVITETEDGIKFTALITSQSLNELELKEGSQVILAIKAAAIHVLA